ncbi:MAG: type II toxin-antitoxin system prevent-host-death family antitoxin [Bryobacterales bacterium]|nr:type II toxin-antitoxin system prevent-host-death family antitoxin [Bryobacterales bacterium]
MESATGKLGNPVTMKASEFKAKCLQLMDQVAAGGGEVIITKHGRPISRLVPFRTKPSTLFGIDRGRIQVTGDIVGPVDVPWEAETDPDRSVAP